MVNLNRNFMLFMVFLCSVAAVGVAEKFYDKFYLCLQNGVSDATLNCDFITTLTERKSYEHISCVSRYHQFGG